MIRNRYMVALSSRIIAVYDGREKGGTFFTIRYAHTMEREIRNYFFMYIHTGILQKCVFPPFLSDVFSRLTDSFW